ncbi:MULTISPECIES: peptidoglycan-binding protein [unclassified Streptomyces]|uniref:peptidoglycan-binding protein n=1 Tax=unclassified Streptomyces TaxID=2593676 RepID=UPI0036E8095E
MTDNTVGSREDHHPGKTLAALLRGWWESSARAGREKPTQHAIAKRLGIDQTTLSRYLNPAHASNAPRRIVEQLHAVLRAPDDDLVRARALADAAAMASPARRRTARTARPQPDPATPPGPQPAAPSRPEPAAPPGAAVPPEPESTAPTRPKSAAPPGPEPAEAVTGAPTPPPVAPATAAQRVDRWWDRSPVVLPTLAVSAFLLLVLGCLVWWMAPTPGGSDAKATAKVSDRPPEGTDWPLARKGNVLWKARTVQYLLRANGFDVKVDADYGPATAEAVKKFQAAHGLTADGKVGNDTWPLLVVTVDSRTTKPDAIEAVQYLLHHAGVPTDTTGVYTLATMLSLKEFQASRSLPVTGVGDEGTWHALLHAQGPDQHK